MIMKRGLPAVSAALAALMLAGCMTAAPGNSTATAALAPPVPKDERRRSRSSATSAA